MTILSDMDDNSIVDAIGTSDGTRFQVRLDNGVTTTYFMKDQKKIFGIAVNDFNGEASTINQSLTVWVAVVGNALLSMPLVRLGCFLPVN